MNATSCADCALTSSVNELQLSQPPFQRKKEGHRHHRGRGAAVAGWRSYRRDELHRFGGLSGWRRQLAGRHGRTGDDPMPTRRPVKARTESPTPRARAASAICAAAQTFRQLLSWAPANAGCGKQDAGRTNSMPERWQSVWRTGILFLCKRYFCSWRMTKSDWRKRRRAPCPWSGEKDPRCRGNENESGRALSSISFRRG